ncbi:hypothetical protein HBA54_20785 [Pelagibius litoralis]|uniref:Lipoprotein n=1 Tax=Pelagibius litoralis TaxID=374515 RepID=A0A967KF17_9PROT|nr:hypothetical protein [Pelagibius litoralis]NIA71040.1 hypothetical protein [Pelagibius litoralis]
MVETRTKRLWRAGFALATGLLLAACATPDDGNERIVALPDVWDPIDLAEADLTLPLSSPFEIDELRERVGAHQLFENLYTFHGLKGFIVTSRVFFGQFARNPTRDVKDPDEFLRYAKGLSMVERRRLRVGSAKPFKQPDLHGAGFYTKALSETRHEDCFIFRIGYLLVDSRNFEREPDAMDTIVTGSLCADKLDEAALLTLLAQIEVVRDRDDFRKALSRSKIGTI